jgi:hypothetical protein
MASASIPAVLKDGDYDEDGWPKGTLKIEHRTYQVLDATQVGRTRFEDLPLLDQASWVAEFEELPGYTGEGKSIDEALMRLKADLGGRPHYRVAREKPRTIDQWRKHIERKHQLAAAAAAIGAQPRQGSDGAAATAKEIGRRKIDVAQAARKFSKAFGEQADGTWVAGDPAWAAQELKRITDEKIELDVMVAKRTPWRLERAEARAKFPPKNG